MTDTSVDDHQLAARLATDAGSLLLELRARMHAEGAEGKAIKDAGDLRSHEFLMAALAEARPDDAVLSEEGKDDLARLDAERVWIIDPLDGTREFGEVPRDDWAVHVALVVDSQPVAGAVALPAQGVTLSSDPSAVVPPAVDGPPRIVVSRTRPPAVATALADALGADLVAMGSAGAKAASVVQGKSDIYPHSGGQYEWDSCAPVAVAAAAGLHVSRIDGSALVYNNADPYLPDLLVCRPELAEQTLAAIAALEG
jgi:3'(2'), 5'-bisphosphate nucleotidase